MLATNGSVWRRFDLAAPIRGSLGRIFGHDRGIAAAAGGATLP